MAYRMKRAQGPTELLIVFFMLEIAAFYPFYHIVGPARLIYPITAGCVDKPMGQVGIILCL
ncbi:histone acetyltransferase HPA2 [Paenibacillus popilliae ATCC 14706]|uniref:Histone acetyltransferase HPA2 n=1 Tax=Paenibacillus popilliae ATCC 14706 TaxID=1212764 RepID=M9LXX6_PAEPP|nr:histone acetyltransferase HPA2 [Paenibacillus popilliae ATCC 14706]